MKAAEKHSVECIVLLTLVYYFELFGTPVANGPLTIYCLTGLLFTQSGRTYQKFPFSGVVSAHTLCAAPECRQCSLCSSTEQKML